MASTKEFADHVVGRLLPFGPVSARRMFGGFGVYLEDAMFGLIAFDALYFKVDDTNRAEYETAGMTPFTYQGRDKPIQMSYWLVPDEVFGDAGALAEWASRARDAALRAKAARKPRKPRKRAQ